MVTWCGRVMKIRRWIVKCEPVIQYAYITWITWFNMPCAVVELVRKITHFTDKKNKISEIVLFGFFMSPNDRRDWRKVLLQRRTRGWPDHVRDGRWNREQPLGPSNLSSDWSIAQARTTRQSADENKQRSAVKSSGRWRMILCSVRDTVTYFSVVLRYICIMMYNWLQIHI